MKPLIIGQAPARGNDGKPPFAGLSGRRLATLAGVGHTGDVLPRYFEMRNLISKYPGKGRGHGDKFDIAAAKQQAALMYEEMKQMKPRTVLFMGRSVAKAFYIRRSEYLVPWQWQQHMFVIFPHPSGVNRWWNEEGHYEQAAEFLREVLRRG